MTTGNPRYAHARRGLITSPEGRVIYYGNVHSHDPRCYGYNGAKFLFVSTETSFPTGFFPVFRSCFAGRS